MDRVAVGQSSVKALQNKNTETLASPITSATIIEGVTFPIFVSELARLVSIEQCSKVCSKATYDMAMDWSGVSNSWLAPARASVDSSALSVRHAWCNATRLPDCIKLRSISGANIWQVW